MKTINRSGVPEPVFRFLAAHDQFYDKDAAKGTISVTTLLRPTQEIVLTQRYDDKIEVDAMDLMWAILGSGVHAALEKVPGYEPVGRLYADLEGFRVSGKPDFIAGNRICDYKVTSAWTVFYGDRLEEWEFQLSLYRWLYFVQTGKTLEGVGVIVPTLRDWTVKEANKNPKYPQAPMIQIEVPLLTLKETEGFCRVKLLAIKKAREVFDGELPLCSEKERWFHAKTGKNRKCDKYCHAAPFCSQKKEMDLVIDI